MLDGSHIVILAFFETETMLLMIHNDHLLHLLSKIEQQQTKLVQIDLLNQQQLFLTLTFEFTLLRQTLYIHFVTLL